MVLPPNHLSYPCSILSAIDFVSGTLRFLFCPIMLRPIFTVDISFPYFTICFSIFLLEFNFRNHMLRQLNANFYIHSSWPFLKFPVYLQICFKTVIHSCNGSILSFISTSCSLLLVKITPSYLSFLLVPNFFRLIK